MAAREPVGDIDPGAPMSDYTIANPLLWLPLAVAMGVWFASIMHFLTDYVGINSIIPSIAGFIFGFIVALRILVW